MRHVVATARRRAFLVVNVKSSVGTNDIEVGARRLHLGLLLQLQNLGLVGVPLHAVLRHPCVCIHELLLVHLHLRFEVVSLQFVVLQFVQLYFLIQYFFLQTVNFLFVPFGFELFLDFGFKHISFVLQPSALSTREGIVSNLKFKIEQFSLLVFVF